MTRPLSHGLDAVRRDIQMLTRCLDRVRTDPKRRGKKREALIKNLQEALVILIEEERSPNPVRKIA